MDWKVVNSLLNPTRPIPDIDQFWTESFLTHYFATTSCWSPIFLHVQLFFAVVSFNLTFVRVWMLSIGTINSNPVWFYRFAVLERCLRGLWSAKIRLFTLPKKTYLNKSMIHKNGIGDWKMSSSLIDGLKINTGINREYSVKELTVGSYRCFGVNLN